MSIWSAVCIALAVAGFVISFFTWRSKGAARGMRAVAWSLIPLAAYLTGAATLLSRIGSAIARFAGSFVFSPKTWVGVVFLGISVLIFLTSGGLPMLRWRKRRAAGKAGLAGGGADTGKAVDGRPAGPTAAGAPAGSGSRAAVPAAKRGKQAATAQDDDLADIEQILRRHGIS